MATHDRYRELRGVLEDLVRAWPAPHRADALAAAQRHLETHCQQCGRALVGAARASGDMLCQECAAPAPAAPLSVRGSARSLPVLDPEDPLDDVLARWPARVHPAVRACWTTPAIVALRQAAAERQMSLPLRATAADGRPVARQRLMADPQVQALLAQSRKF